MIDLGRWIYSNDIAEWLMNRDPLSIEEQIDCICSAPHRTMAEKIEELKILNLLHKENQLCNKIKCIEALVHHVNSDVPIQQYLYATDIYYHGEKEWSRQEGIFMTAKKATEEIRRQIRKSAEQDNLAKESFYGVIHVLHEIAPYEYRNEENLILNCDGEIIFCQPDFNNMDPNMSAVVDTGEYHYLKIPYHSGTIITVEENSFFPPLKGVVVNGIEPDEVGFSDSRYNQWLVYPDFWNIDRTNGIGIVNLRDDYVPFSSNPDFLLSYKHFIKRYDGELTEKETWLSEFSELVKTDKDCIRTMLSDRQPRNGNLDQRRCAYVRELMTRTKQGA